MKCKLSIITINFNNKEGLEKTFESVVNQKYKDFEYIVIDGGSTDGSKEFLEQNQDKITYWVSEPDKGIYNAMNKGILKAKGTYLQFLNSGDFLTNSTILEQVAPYLNDSDVVYGNMIKSRIDENGVENTTVDYGPRYNELTLRTFIVGTLNHSSTFIAKDLFDKYGLYDETLKIISDWKFFLIACGLNKCEGKYIDIDVAVFDMTGISNSQKEKLFAEKESVLKALIPQTILADYNNTADDVIRLQIIRKHKFTAFMLRFLEALLVRISRLLTKLNF